jgi:hypothetical protein
VAHAAPRIARFPLPLRAPRVPRLPQIAAPFSRVEAAWICALLLLLGLISLMYLLETSSVATVGYDIQRLQVQQKQWELKNEQLQLELAKMQSLVWVESRAAQLGMQRPEQTLTLHVQVQRPEEPATTAASDGGENGR